MLSYASSLKKGLDAARVAQGNKEEIHSVLEELKRQVLTETEGKIKIEIHEFYKNTTVRGDMTRFMREAIEGISRETYKAIAASNPLAIEHEPKELARWTLDKAGYPCIIAFGDVKYICEDKEALRNNLSLLLENPSTGEKLYQLMKLPTQDDDAEAELEDN